MPVKTKWSVCAATLVLCAGSAAAFHPGGEEEKLLGKGDSSEARFGNFPSSNVAFLSQVSLAQFGLSAPSGNDCWGYVTPQGKEIAIMGLETGTGFVDITNPVSPVIIGAFSGPQSLWRDIKVIGSIAYVVTEGGSHIQKFDLSNADNGVIGNLGFSSYSGSGASHNIVANPDSGYLYRVGGANDLGLRAYGVGVNGAPGSATNPSQQSIQSNLYVHDAQVVSYTSGPYAGREIAFLCSGFGNGGSDTRLRIFDVTNKSNIVQLSSVAYPGRAYCHQGWLSEDRKYFYINDELDVPNSTMRIINVENINAPFHVKNWNNGNPARHHNLYVRGDYIYAANYRSGLRIHDISDPENPVEVAWFDTFPSDDGTGFDGAWSNYPYFPSGNIIISDIQQGLIVVRPELEVLSISLDSSLGTTVSPAGGDEVVATIAERSVTLDATTPALNVRDESGVVTVVPGVATGSPNQFRFETPALECLENIDWWISAETTAGALFTLPALAPTSTFSAVVATDVIATFSDNAETDPGYTVSSTATDGQWVRAIPVNAGRGDPATDADGSGRAWVTDNEAGNSDVDNGSTTLTSPAIDASAGGALTYSYWLNDIPTGEIGPEDFLRVQYATNAAGTNWATLRTYTQVFNQWRQETVLVGAGGEIPATGTLRLRFIAADNSPGQVLEAGIDAISLTAFECVPPPNDCVADTNGDGVLSPADFSAWIAAFNAGAPECDQNDDNACTPADFSAWIANYNAGCP